MISWKSSCSLLFVIFLTVKLTASIAILNHLSMAQNGFISDYNGLLPICVFLEIAGFEISGCPIVRDNQNQVQATQCAIEVAQWTPILFQAALTHLRIPLTRCMH